MNMHGCGFQSLNGSENYSGKIMIATNKLKLIATEKVVDKIPESIRL